MFLNWSLAALFEQKNWGRGWPHIFLFVGFLGSFTTFSTYTFDTFLLLKSDKFMDAFLNMGLQIILGLALAIAGWYSVYGIKSLVNIVLGRSITFYSIYKKLCWHTGRNSIIIVHNQSCGITHPSLSSYMWANHYFLSRPKMMIMIERLLSEYV